MSKYLGKMMTGSCRVCGGMVTGMWLDEHVSASAKKMAAGDWVLRDLIVETKDRYDSDPVPRGCDDRSHRGLI